MGANKSLWRRSAGSCLQSFVLPALALGSNLTTVPVSAQDAQSVRSTPTSNLCRVYAVESTAGGENKDLRAHCRGRGVMLGTATSFEAIDNEAIGATLVDLHRGVERRVLLLTIQADGTPMAEDLTGQIALTAGRGPMSEIDGVELDLKAFARTGEVGVKGGLQDTGPDKADRIRLRPQIAAERARRGAAAQN